MEIKIRVLTCIWGNNPTYNRNDNPLQSQELITDVNWREYLLKQIRMAAFHLKAKSVAFYNDKVPADLSKMEKWSDFLELFPSTRLMLDRDDGEEKQFTITTQDDGVFHIYYKAM